MQQECCPKFDPEPWHDKTIVWDKKLFIKDSVRTFLFMPLNFGAVMRRITNTADKGNANIPDWLCLSDHVSKWKMDLYLAVDKSIPNTEMMELTGSFYSRVYEGNFNQTGDWMQDFEQKCKEMHLEKEKNYTWYTTCPKCAKKYGKNYVVIIAKIK